MELNIVDCNYVRPEMAGSGLWISDGPSPKAFFVECNTNYAIPHLVEAVRSRGLRPEDVEGLVITHVHLDHAGGAGLFLKTFPSARVYAHPRAARHLIDPSKLIQSATQVYGTDWMNRLYGDILPCPAERVVALQEQDQIQWSGGTFETGYLRGHANHHVSLYEPLSKTLHTGDTFGVSYPSLNHKKGKVIAIASTSPTDFDGPAALESIDWVLGLNPARFVPTHYGIFDQSELPTFAQQLRDQLRFSMALIQKIRSQNLSEPQVLEHIHDWMIQSYAAQGVQLDTQDLDQLMVDFKVNAQGLCFSAQKV